MLVKYIKNTGLLLGIIGLVMFMFGLAEESIDNKNMMILMATFFLFTSAVIQKEPFFSGLQGIAFVSAIMVFYQISPIYNLGVFLCLAVGFAIYYFAHFPLNAARIYAFIGLVTLCLGIVFGRNEFMVVCGIFLAIYAMFSIKEGFTVGWVFLVLNILFSLVALNALYKFY